MPVDWLLVIWDRETIVSHDVVIEMRRVFGRPWTVWVAEIHAVQSKGKFVSIAPLE